ncbi:hypothetical protein AB0X98_01035 [Rothia koreensis]|uniref:hypothetical protein n=1 Tax=Rothia koreensis TaxID=592378 RepID=UPI003F241B38
MTDLDLEAIKARAQAAEGDSPSSWRAQSRRGGYATIHCGDLHEIGWPGEYGPVFTEATAAHIAGMDPVTTLALIDRIERLEADWLDAVTSGEWAAFQLAESRDALRGTLGENK